MDPSETSFLHFWVIQKNNNCDCGLKMVNYVRVFFHTLCLLLNHMLICYATVLLICIPCTSAVKEI